MRKLAPIAILISILVAAFFTIRNSYVSHAQSPQSIEVKTEMVAGHEAAAGRVMSSTETRRVGLHI